MKDLKLEENQTVEEKVKQLMAEQGWVAGKNANSIAVTKDDVFTIVNVEKPNFGNQQTTTNNDWQQCVFLLSNGASLGVRHFNKAAQALLGIDDTAPTLGRRIEDVLAWAIYVAKEEIEFKCTKVKTEAKRKIEGTEREYTPKNYEIELN